MTKDFRPALQHQKIILTGGTFNALTAEASKTTTRPLSRRKRMIVGPEAHDFFGSLNDPGDDYDWSGGGPYPAAAEETKQLYAERAKVILWVPVRVGYVRRLRCWMMNRLSGDNAVKVYPVFRMAGSPCPDTTVYPSVLTVTGTLTPDATGVYYRNGGYGGKPAWQRADGAYWLRWELGAAWILSDAKGQNTNTWSKPALEDDYVASGTYTGTATVAATAWATLDSAANIDHAQWLGPRLENDELLGVRVEVTAIDGGGWGYADEGEPNMTATVEYENESR